MLQFVEVPKSVKRLKNVYARIHGKMLDLLASTLPESHILRGHHLLKLWRSNGG
jgi:hypothetical protein